jgi:L-threonylcarbamoyladenylate synthase
LHGADFAVWRLRDYVPAMDTHSSDAAPRLCPATEAGIAEAAALLRAGGLVAFPTETVYGLGADATNEAAVARIFAAKGRPPINPLIVHLAAPEEAAAHARVDARAAALMEAFWPGPLTLVLPRRADCKLAPAVSAGLSTVALRVPSLPLARKLIAATGKPLAAPSANRSGTVSPTAPVHVIESLGGAVDAVIAGGRCAIGLESSVVDLTGEVATLLRPGAVTLDDLAALLGGEVAMLSGATEEGVAQKSPGLLLKHYAPRLPLRLEAKHAHEGEALLAFGPDRFARGKAATVMNLSERGDLEEAAANLFAMLRALDTTEHTGIAVMPVPQVGIGVAINDRLRRAAAAQGREP